MSYLSLQTFLSDSTNIDYYNSDKLLVKFPAQFRLSSKEIRSCFPSSLPFKSIGNYLSFPFEPVLGFYREDASEWYGVTQESLNSKYVIVTFGGSTTVQDNWPKYLIKEAKEQNVSEDIVVLNAGHWGYMSFLEKLYFTGYILPMLEKAKIKPNLVLSMDGVNDIWARIMSYLESVEQQSPHWYSNYHSYHQTLDTDIRQLGKVSVSVKQTFSSIARICYKYSIYFFTPIFPYTCKATLELLRKILQNPVEKKSLKTDYDKLILLDEETENNIIYAFKNSLVDFCGTVYIRGIRFIAYLQPVLLENYYPHPVPDSLYYPSFNYFGRNFHRENRYWSRSSEDTVVNTEGLYSKAEKLYHDLNSYYPDNFKSLASLFRDIPQAETLYQKDAIHYRQRGKEIIASAVIRDLIEKGILTKNTI